MLSKNTHKAYRQVCCKEPLSFGLKITSLVSFGFAPFNLYCYGKPLDLDRAENHWGHHNGVWQLLFSHVFGSKIKIPGKVNTGWMEISRTTLGTAVKSESLSLNVLRRCRTHADTNAPGLISRNKWMFVHIHTTKIWLRFSESLEQKAFPVLLFLKLGHYNKYIISNNCTQRSVLEHAKLNRLHLILV